MQSNFKNDLAVEQGRKDLNRFLIETITREKIVAECNDYRFDFKLSNEKTVEVKNMSGADITGNLTIETKGNKGKPSGITTSEANDWMITYNITENQYGILFIPLSALKRVNLFYDKYRTGREGSVVNLVPANDKYLQRYLKGTFNVTNNYVTSIKFLYPNEEFHY